MRVSFTIFFLILFFTANSQLLTWSPDFIQESSSPIDIIMDATKGNQGLKDYTPTTDLYVHIAVITSKSTSSSDWKYVKFSNFSAPDPSVQATYVSANKWKFTITGGLRAFFGITDNTESILKIAILFRNGNGTKVQRNADASDMYIPVYAAGLNVRLTEPFKEPKYNPTPEPINKSVGDAITITAKSSQAADLKLFLNGTQVGTTVTNGTSITATPTITTTGTQTIIAQATSATTAKSDTITFFVSSSTAVLPLPAGVKDGINYEAGDTSVTLVLYAPTKSKIAVLGDFNNWSPVAQMNVTPDGNRFWIRITGLTPGTEYAYQYLIDNTLKVADYNAEKVLDPANDQFIPATTYPGLKAYPTGKTTGIVSVLQTAKQQYSWQVNNFAKPDKRNLVIYELLVRDFVAAQNWSTLKDTLTYLKRLGINAIEVMPFNEFEGNNSWGYNPSFYFAPDKIYGPENTLRAFIDECHKNGIAVIMDIAMNHSFGQSPMVQMYFDAANNRPAANSPWFNQTATHPFNVGYDFNHESQATKDFVDRVVEHWLTKYKIDGFRWDLSKGFTQKNSCTTTNCDQQSEVNNWSAYDASRVAIWKRIYDKMQSTVTNSYCILEHFADNTEEIELSNYGMLLWGNLNYNFNEATMGYVNTSNFQGGIYKQRGWSQPNLVTYQESHDEERLMYKNEQFGNTSGSYNVKDINTGLKRNEMAASFWATIPGPKMLWQFEELGYDYSINTCTDGTVNNNCRLSAKPIRWDYYQNPNRKALYDVYAKLIKLKLTPSFATTFTTGDVTWDLSPAVKWLKVSSDSLKVMVVGNFDVTAQTSSVTFPAAGTWYSYLTNSTRTATGSAENITLQPGEYYVYTNRDVNNLTATPVNSVSNAIKNMAVTIYPNPVSSNATIEYDLPGSGTVNISVLDLAGRQVGILFSGFKARGVQKMPINIQGFSTKALHAGTYMLKLSVNGQSKVKEFIINN
jgi:1,4-alpha-glucan branching enzyme